MMYAAKSQARSSMSVFKNITPLSAISYSEYMPERGASIPLVFFSAV
jgi:hypothetical protein